MSKCCICEKDSEKNIKLLGKFICEDCEWKILKEQVHSTGYNRCVEKLKKIRINNTFVEVNKECKQNIINKNTRGVNMDKTKIKKVVLAYSGGLDTTAMIPWLKEKLLLKNTEQQSLPFTKRQREAMLTILLRSIQQDSFLSAALICLRTKNNRRYE